MSIPAARKSRHVVAALVATLALAALPALLAGCASRQQPQLGNVENTVQGNDIRLMRCDQPLGVAALVEPEDTAFIDTLSRFGLTSPIPILRILMQDSNCFQVADRGEAFRRLQAERELFGEELELVRTDFLVTPAILVTDPDAGGGGIGGLLGGLFGGAVGAVAAGIDITNLEAEVTLTLTNARTGLQEASAKGSARKEDIGFGAGALLGGLGGGGAGVGGAYSDTDIGKLVMVAFLDAHNKLVENRRPVTGP